MLARMKRFVRRRQAWQEKPAAEAYDLWSASYDAQPHNLMLALDKIIFHTLIKDVELYNRKIADIGCGTGRHWPRLYKGSPLLLAGFDVSEGMLNQLRARFPAAVTFRIDDSLSGMVPFGYMDCIISTLTIAHIKNVDQAICSWSQVLADGGDLVITDFHPEMLARGGRRSFEHEGVQISVTNYLHPIERLKEIFRQNGMQVVREETRYVDAEVRSWYEAQNAIKVYERFEGTPVIYGMHLKKCDASQ